MTDRQLEILINVFYKIVFRLGLLAAFIYAAYVNWSNGNYGIYILVAMFVTFEILNSLGKSK